MTVDVLDTDPRATRVDPDGSSCPGCASRRGRMRARGTIRLAGMPGLWCPHHARGVLTYAKPKPFDPPTPPHVDVPGQVEIPAEPETPPRLYGPDDRVVWHCGGRRIVGTVKTTEPGRAFVLSDSGTTGWLRFEDLTHA